MKQGAGRNSQHGVLTQNVPVTLTQSQLKGGASGCPRRYPFQRSSESKCGSISSVKNSVEDPLPKHYHPVGSTPCKMHLRLPLLREHPCGSRSITEGTNPHELRTNDPPVPLKCNEVSEEDPPDSLCHRPHSQRMSVATAYTRRFGCSPLKGSWRPE